jgi:hypothetical protein
MRNICFSQAVSSPLPALSRREVEICDSEFRVRGKAKCPRALSGRRSKCPSPRRSCLPKGVSPMLVMKLMVLRSWSWLMCELTARGAKIKRRGDRKIRRRFVGWLGRISRRAHRLRGMVGTPPTRAFARSVRFAHPCASTSSFSAHALHPSYVRKSFALETEGVGNAGCPVHPQRVTPIKIRRAGWSRRRNPPSLQV